MRAWVKPVSGDLEIPTRWTDRDVAGTGQAAGQRQRLVHAAWHGLTGRTLAPPVFSLSPRGTEIPATRPRRCGWPLGWSKRPW